MERLSVAERKFPFRVRADLQRAIEQLLRDGEGVVRFCGVRKPYSHEGIDLASLLTDEPHNPAVAVPPQYEDVDVGEEQPVRCLKTGLWLMQREGSKYAVLLSRSMSMQYGRPEGTRCQVMTSNDARGERIAEALFRDLETAVSEAHAYRGKILSLEEGDNYSGQAVGIKVHKLQRVEREQVILPKQTVALLERNVIQFVQRREKLAKYGQATKKGLLFYGPPGTGKSHTIRYLAGALEGHTTLIITADQVGMLDEYMTLARLLQPSVVVIEDVDLVARDREEIGGPCAEALLNRLLNEMDGLKEEADILFILTTNRPEALEMALASRPGRVDQAIEFPLPDAAGREKLIRLYGGGVPISDEVIRAIVRRTDHVSAAFIKELMRRSVQFLLERDGSGAIEIQDVDNALDEILFSGGRLNVKLLGGNVDGQESELSAMP